MLPKDLSELAKHLIDMQVIVWSYIDWVEARDEYLVRLYEQLRGHNTPDTVLISWDKFLASFNVLSDWIVVELNATLRILLRKYIETPVRDFFDISEDVSRRQIQALAVQDEASRLPPLNPQHRQIIFDTINTIIEEADMERSKLVAEMTAFLGENEHAKESDVVRAAFAGLARYQIRLREREKSIWIQRLIF